MTTQNDSSQKEVNIARRALLTKGALGAAAVTIAPGVILHQTATAEPRKDAVTADVRWGMLIDTAKCADGCTSCVEACDHENGLDLQQQPEGSDDKLWDMQKSKWMRSVTLKDNLTGRETTLPMMCQHCENPPCVDVCPTNASMRREDGVVLVDRHRCIGCRYCMMACPYKARSFIHQVVDVKLSMTPRGKGCVESCNFCVHRLDNGNTTTACQEACAKDGHDAIIFGDLKDPNSAVAKAMKNTATRQVRDDLKLNTGVRYANI